MQTEPGLIHLPLGLAATPVVAVIQAATPGDSGFGAALGLEQVQPGGAQDDAAALPFADTTVVGAFWPAVPLASLALWSAVLPSDKAAPADAASGMTADLAGVGAGPEPDRAAGKGESPRFSQDDSTATISGAPIPVAAVGTLAPSDDDPHATLTRDPATNLPAGPAPTPKDALFGANPPRDRALSRAESRLVSAPAPDSMPTVPPDAKPMGQDHAFAEVLHSESADRSGPGLPPGPDTTLSGIAPRFVTGKEPPGDGLRLHARADVEPDKTEAPIAHPGLAARPGEVLLAKPDTGEQPRPSPASSGHNADAQSLSGGPIRDAKVSASDAGADFGPVQDPAEAGSDRSAPATDRTAQSSQARPTGAERLWLGAQHLRADPPGVPDERTGENGRPGASGTEPRIASPGHPASAPVAVRTGAPPALFAASGLAGPGLRQAEETVMSTEPALAVADRLPAVPSGFAGAPLPPADPVPMLATRIVATLTQRAGGLTEVALAPDELGSVRLQFQMDAQNPDRIVIHLSFDRSETMDLFRRHADQLTEAIRSAGYAEARLDFGQAGSGSGDGARPGWAGHKDDGADLARTTAGDRAAGGAEPDISYALRPSGIAGMDLRL